MVEYNPNDAPKPDSDQLDAAFIAMADATRRSILARLAKGDARVTEIAEDFPVSLNAVSKHIKILERSELVRRRVKGREHVLSLNAEAMINAAQWMDYYRQFWEANLESLETFINKQHESAKKGNSK